MAAKDFSKVRCPSCGLTGTLRKDGKFAVCQDHLCGNAFPITRSGAFLSASKKKASDSEGKKKDSSPDSDLEAEVPSSAPGPDDEDPLDDWGPEDEDPLDDIDPDLI